MKKKIVACLVIAVLACAGLIGCGNTNNTNSTDKTNNKETAADSTKPVPDVAPKEEKDSSTRTKEKETKESSTGKKTKETKPVVETKDVAAPQNRNDEVNKLVESVVDDRDKKAYEKLYAKKKAVEAVPEVSGEWSRTDVHNSLSAWITISDVTKEGFDFSVEASYYSHSGNMEDHAFWVTGDVAVCKFEDEGGGESHYVLFVWQDDRLKVYASESSGSFGFGMNVTMDGDYVTGEPTYTNADILKNTFSDAQLDFLKEKLSESDYENFIFITENGGVSIEEDGQQKIISAIVPTMGGDGYRIEIRNDQIIKVFFSEEKSYSFEK